jgi:hypothetical protein
MKGCISLVILISASSSDCANAPDAKAAIPTAATIVNDDFHIRTPSPHRPGRWDEDMKCNRDQAPLVEAPLLADCNDQAVAKKNAPENSLCQSAPQRCHIDAMLSCAGFRPCFIPP